MSEVKYVLRDLPGVADLEAILDRCQEHPNPKWAPARDEAEVLAARLSRTHFGLTIDETRYQPNHLLKGYENEHNDIAWEHVFEFLTLPFEDQAEVWGDLGWDVRRADGAPLRSLEFLGRQIVAAALGIAGHEPGEGELSPPEQQDIEARLRAEAAKFRPKR